MGQPDEPHLYSAKYPPKNRKPLGLNIVEVQLEDGVGKLTVDLNRAAVMGATQRLPVVSPKFASFLSGKPGYMYRNSDGVEVALAEDELLRLLRRDLRPHEVLALHQMFGAFHETHDDFYDEDTGTALQPM